MSAEQTTKAVGYIRVATGSSRKRERSVCLQRQVILRYAKMTDTRIVRFFADHVCISDIAMRQGLSDALACIAGGAAGALVVTELACLTSSVEELRCFVEQNRILKDGPALIAVREGIDTRTAQGRSILAALDTLACWQVNELSGGA